MTNRFGFDLLPHRLRWAAAERVSEDVIAAVLLLGTIIYAYTDADYRDRADPEEVLMFLKEASVPADDRRPKRKVG
jgi:hypothetical protein